MIRELMKMKEILKKVTITQLIMWGILSVADNFEATDFFNVGCVLLPIIIPVIFVLHISRYDSKKKMVVFYIIWCIEGALFTGVFAEMMNHGEWIVPDSSGFNYIVYWLSGIWALICVTMATVSFILYKAISSFKYKKALYIICNILLVVGIVISRVYFGSEINNLTVMMYICFFTIACVYFNMAHYFSDEMKKSGMIKRVLYLVIVFVLMISSVDKYLFSVLIK